jgi:hypothetical protein
MTDSFLAARGVEEAFNPEQLLVGGGEAVTRPNVFQAGADVPALTVCGRVTATGKLVKSVKGANDGSQVPCAVAAANVPCASADKTAPAYVSGEFNVSALLWDASWMTDVMRLGAFTEGRIVPKMLLPQTPGYFTPGYVDEGYAT